MAVVWTKLSDCNDHAFYAGTVFRFAATEPYEPVVDYMLMLDGSVAQAGLKFVVTTGYKAGAVNILCTFPQEAYVAGALAIRAEWLSQNWREWVYPDTDPKQIFVLENYPAPDSLPE